MTGLTKVKEEEKAENQSKLHESIAQSPQNSVAAPLPNNHQRNYSVPVSQNKNYGKSDNNKNISVGSLNMAGDTGHAKEARNLDDDDCIASFSDSDDSGKKGKDRKLTLI